MRKILSINSSSRTYLIRFFLVLALVALMGFSTIHFSSFASTNYIPCNYSITIYYHTNPSNVGNINGFTDGQTQTFTYNNVPCQDNTYGYTMYAHPAGDGFSLWQASGGTLSSPVDNGTTLTVVAHGSSTSAQIYANFVIGLLAPLYIYPDLSNTSGYWQTLINDKANYPNVPIIAIVNPSDFGTIFNGKHSTDATYASAISTLQKNVIGYVWTCYGTRILSGDGQDSGQVQVGNCGAPIGTYYSYGAENDIAYWQANYSVTGIFLDEMNNSGGSQGASYYSTLTSFAHNKGLDIVVGNPGYKTTSSYVGSTDIMTPYEGSGQPSQLTVQDRTTNIGGISSQWGFFAYSVASVPSQSYLKSLNGNAGWIYETNYNVYSKLPSYLAQELSNLGTT